MSTASSVRVRRTVYVIHALHHNDGTWRIVDDLGTDILEINQVTAYFAYANRTVLGLGITTHGDDLGTAPPESDDVTAWRHG